MKAKIHTTFDLKTGPDWAEAKDLVSEAQLREEVIRLRRIALACINAKHDNKVIVDKIDLSRYEKKNIEKSAKEAEVLLAAMKSNILFKRCRVAEMQELLGNFEPCSFTAGETIIRQGEKGDSFYVLKAGKCDVFLAGHPKCVASLREGTSFGELALMYNTPRAASIVAAEAVACWRISREEYRLVLAVSAQRRSAQFRKLLEGVVLRANVGPEKTERKKLLKDAITPEQLAHLADAMDEDNVEAGHAIIREGDVGHTFYILAEGTVEISTRKDGVVSTLEPGGYFGDRALTSDDKRAATCTAKTRVKLVAMDREDFIALLGSIEELVESGTSAEEATAAVAYRAADKITLEELDVKRTLGQGAFGRVKLVTHKPTGVHYALKSQSKAAIVENNLQAHVLMERDILMQLDHPFIITLASSFQDRFSIYFLLELLIGGELFSHLRKAGRFPESTMKFYSASVVVAFEHMHSKKIAYRDLKPENLVLDKGGYMKLVDLGLAKLVPIKTWTLCGTPDYLAPEIILNEGHDKAVDYWALGVLMFELVAGVPPFYADDPMEVYEKILSGSMSFPSHLSKYLTDVIRKLLKLSQSKRLGNGKGGCGVIKKHRFFSGFDIDALEQMTAKPPIDIKVADDADASNFDTYDEDNADKPEECTWAPKLDYFEANNAA